MLSVAEEVQTPPSVRLGPPLLGVDPRSSLWPATEGSGPAAFSWRLVLMPTGLAAADIRCQKISDLDLPVVLVCDLWITPPPPPPHLCLDLVSPPDPAE